MGAVKRVIDEVREWVNAPIVGSVDPMHLFLVTGLVLVSLILWMMILAHIRLAAEAI
jgi:hypothetical protein